MTDIPLIWQKCDTLGRGARLPSIRDVLRVFFHTHNTEKLTHSLGIAQERFPLQPSSRFVGEDENTCYFALSHYNSHFLLTQRMGKRHEPQRELMPKNKNQKLLLKTRRLILYFKTKCASCDANDPNAATREDRDFLMAQKN